MTVTRATRPMTRAGDLISVYEMSDKRTFTVNRYGWVIENDEPVPHPLVDAVMRAILAWERSRG